MDVGEALGERARKPAHHTLRSCSDDARDHLRRRRRDRDAPDRGRGRAPGARADRHDGRPETLLVQAKEFKEQELRRSAKKSLGVSARDAEAIGEAVPGVEIVAQKIAHRAVQGAARRLGAASREVPRRLGQLRRDDEPRRSRREGFLDAEDDARLRAGLRRRTRCPPRPVRVRAGPRKGPQGERSVADGGRSHSRPAAGAGQRLPGGQGRRHRERQSTFPSRPRRAGSTLDRLRSPVDELDRARRARDGRSRRRPRSSTRSSQRLHGGADDYGIVVPEALLEQSRRTQRLFNVVMGCIAGSSLLVGSGSGS